ncbi:MAG TPA: DHA2 family efflux MFS transporter permease subunit [Thermoleophilaceae bacterium]|nr:DHA2 family efflux MFS transporter permease subunit [Thermoleophilaceae bacterium]
MPTPSQASQAARRLRSSASASPQLVLAIVCAGVVLASLDLFIVNVALPQMARDFHVQGNAVADLSWVLNAYAIIYAALLVLFGRVAERFPRERAFLLGVAIFVAASAACGAATTVAMLVAFRVVQAAGAALLTPTSLGLILATSPPERRAGTVRTWTAVGGLAAAAGPVVGGLLVALSWRWVFLVNVPVGLVALAVGWRRLPHVPGHPVPRPDALGALLITGGVGALVLGLVNGPSWGWGDARTLGALAAGVVAIALFTLHALRHRNPLVDRALFRLRPFTGASAVALFFSVAFGAMLLSRVLWAQDVWHWSALTTGLAIAPGPLMVPLFSFLLAGRLTARFGPGPVIAAGSTVFAAGAAWWALAMGLEPDYAGDMLGGMILTGIGVGLTLPTLMATGASSLPPHSFATGSAVINMLRQIGLAVGVAILIAIVGSARSGDELLHVYERSSWVIAALSLAGGAVGLALLPRRPGEATSPTRAAVAENPAT